MGKELKMQPSLIHIATAKDVVYTPAELARDMVAWFQPEEVALDPCMGDGAFYNLLPAGSEWCEIEKGRDFYAWSEKVNWIIGNPPYSNLLAWIRHSFTVADDIVYLMPLHRVFASNEFMRDLHKWGGVFSIRLYGTGAQWGFSFGHALAAVHYQVGYSGPTSWSRYEVRSVTFSQATHIDIHG